MYIYFVIIYIYGTTNSFASLCFVFVFVFSFLVFSSVVGPASTRLGVNKIMTLELVRLIAHLFPAPSLFPLLPLSLSLRGSSYQIQLVLIILLYLPTNN